MRTTEPLERTQGAAPYALPTNAVQACGSPAPTMKLRHGRVGG
jgi:hypothetical protein